ncbi:MAG: CinA family protein, partial [Bacteroidota bacterium]
PPRKTRWLMVTVFNTLNFDLLKEKINHLTNKITDEIQEFVYGFEGTSIEEAVGALLKDNNLTLSIAESCTGGNISKMITSIPGSSAYYLGSVVSYANEIKQEFLGVSQSNLENYGAVSEQVVREMQKGVLKQLKTDLSIATSGIMGPTGGSPEKPVGTVYICVGNSEKSVVEKLSLYKDRNLNIQYTSKRALDILRKFIKNEY